MESFSPDRQTIVRALQQAPRPTIAVIGDYCLDQYFYFEEALDEPSVETGLTAWQVRRRVVYPGVGGTIAGNLASLGADVRCIGLCGDDGAGYELRRALEKIADISGMISSAELVTGTYIKPMRPVDGRMTEGNRIDLRGDRPVSEALGKRLREQVAEVVPQCAAVVISDQFTREAGSVFCDTLRDFLAETAEKNPHIFFLADSRSFAERYRNMAVKCNASEILGAARRLNDPRLAATVEVDPGAEGKNDALLEAGRRLSRRNARPVLVTRGANATFLFEASTVTSIPTVPVSGPIDICGAGDATNAALAFGRALGLTLANAAYLAAVVSSITVRQIGVTGTATVEQVLSQIGPE